MTDDHHRRSTHSPGNQFGPGGRAARRDRRPRPGSFREPRCDGLPALSASRPCRQRRPVWLRPRGVHRFGHGDGNGDAEDGHTSAGDGDADGSTEAGVLEAVRERAAALHERLAHEHGVFAVELVGSTGGGKTALGEHLVEACDGRAGVICGDVAGADDAERYREHGVPVQNVTTGKDCHLDPARVGEALEAFDLGALDALVIENVGNMVCPADFPLGASVRLLVVSPTEGDDVVRKHPLLFQAVDAVAVNKVDIASAVGADVDRMCRDAAEVAPDLPVVRTSATTGRGLADLTELLAARRGTHHE